MPHRFALALCFTLSLGLTLGLVGCTDSHGEEDDAEITFDANLPLPDAGPPPTMVGIACSTDSDCDSGSCVTDFPGGYCTEVCTGPSDCPGSACVTIDPRDGTAICLASCDPTASSCRPGYGCTLDGVCYPGCDTDEGCTAGLTCRPDAGFSGEGACYDPAGLGQPCGSSADCAGDASCNSEGRWGFPGGACVGRGCELSTNTQCPGDAQCVPFGFGGGTCIDGCATDDDCRDAYTCTTLEEYPDRKVCLPAFDAAALGQVCSAGRGGCVGGECLSESLYGWPDSYCVAVGCTPGATPSDCPGDGVCWGVGDGICLDGCDPAGDACRAGYACVPADPTDPTSPTACRPACTVETHCANDGFVCNVGTGLCTEAFDPDDLGDPCIDDPSVCVGGRCLAEDDEGWPGGTCTYPGCALSSGATGATCPTGSACIDDEGGNPDLGVCVSTCSVATPTCRTGYACVAITEGMDEGVCRPACTEGICGATRTCNVTSGLCEGA